MKCKDISGAHFEVGVVGTWDRDRDDKNAFGSLYERGILNVIDGLGLK